MTEGRHIGTWDYVIVGAGSAGCVLANRLSARAGNRVLLLEAGASDNYHWVHIPIGYLYCMGNPRTDWGYKTVAETGLNGRQLAYPRGKIMGGCSSINGMIYMRGQAADYDHWQQLGNPGWGWEDVLPLFRKSERHHRLGGPFHGQDGEMRVERQQLSWPILDAVREAAEELGVPKIEDFNAGDNFGSSYFEVNQKSGFRFNSVRAFLKPVRHRANLTVLSQAQVQRLLFDGRCQRARGEAQGRNRTCRRRQGTDPVGGRHRLAAAPAAVGHRTFGAVGPAWHPGAARPDRGRREPAGSPADPHGLQGIGGGDAE